MANTIGEQLKQARLARKWSLDQAAKATFIRRDFLEALEEDRRDALPSRVQGRGFLRLYAAHLNLPVEPLLAQWDGRPPEPSPVDPVMPPETPVSPETFALPAAAPQPPAAPPEPAIPLVILDEPAPLGTVSLTNEEPAPLAASQAILREIGLQLSQQRTALGLTQAEVERYTRLRQHYIQALEEGRLDGLPSPVQGRGMLSNYAAFLNLDEDALLLRFAEALQVRRVERMPKPDPQPLIGGKKRPARQATPLRRFLTPDLIFGVSLAAIILSFALWMAARINTVRTAEEIPTPPDISSILLTPDEQASLTPGAEIAQGTALSGGAVENTPAVQDTLSAPGDLPTGAPVAGVTATLPPLNKDPLQVYIVARQSAWLRVIADGKVRFLGRVVPGNAYAFSGTRRVELATGNAAGIQVFYNQTDLGSLGLMGDVASFVFTTDGGVMTPTAAFTPTPLPTKIPTLTPLPSATPLATATITPFVP
jgi:cytoskeletal protein RodZ